MKLYLLVLLLVVISQGEEYHCVWYKECGLVNEKVRNCYTNDTAKLIGDDTAKERLKKRCPHFFEDTDDPKTCCDSKQIKTMSKSMELAEGILGRCQSCLKNLFRSICDFTCRPDQSRFMKATETRTNEAGKTYIESIEIYLSENYANATYDSCRDIVNPASGQLAMEFACNGAKTCTPKKWFDYMGDDQTPFVPFLIEYSYDSDGLDSPLEPPTKDCNEPYDNSSMACSCVDCRASCKASDTPVIKENFEIFGWSGYGVIAGLSVLGISTVFTICVIWSSLKYEDEESDLSSTSSISCDEKFDETSTRGEIFRRSLEFKFVKLGTFFAKHPVSSLAIVSDFVMLLSFGIHGLRITSNPIEIWSAPGSRARIEKAYFDEHFRPFFRTEQIFIKSVGLDGINYNVSNQELEFGPVFQKKFLLAVLDLQDQIMQLGQEDGEGLEKICYAPVKNDFSGPTTLSHCTVQSIWGYLKNDKEELEEEDYLETLYKCLENSYNIDCLAPYKGPIIPAIAVGGFLKDGKSNYGGRDYINSTGLVLTFLVNSPPDEKTRELTLKWEQRFIDFMKKWNDEERPKFMDVAYSTERSIEDELERTSKAEAKTVIISYALMFVYVALALGEYKSISQFFLYSKVALSIGGIIIVLSSVTCAVGIFGYLGIPTSLLVIEVMPFLVLAVGVDNIFILVRSVQKNPRAEGESVPGHIGRVVGLVGPSLLLSSASEVFCFSIGILSEMPAVKTFAMFATVAVVINFLLQMTAFVSMLALDARRVKNDRLDICCCVLSSERRALTGLEQGLISWFFEKIYAPFIVKKPVSIMIVVVFSAFLSVSAFVMPTVEIGLDQQLALPDDSYVYKYFKYMQDLLSMGPPVYFVVTKGLDYSNFTVQNAISGASGCNDDSLYLQIFSAANKSDETFIAQSASSWLDDYYDWSLLGGCCKYFPNNMSFCPHDNNFDCDACNIPSDDKYQLRPNRKSFRKYIQYFLSDVPDEECAKGGRAAYLDSINYEEDNVTGLTDVGDTYFMTYHTPMKKPSDWYEALRSARLIANSISNMINGASLTNKQIKVFPYSVFYVFYEQYLTITSVTVKSLILSLAAIFVVTFVLSGYSLFSAMIVFFIIAMILIDLFGFMVLMEISLNGVSLVNLVMAAGISVEFCSHIVHAYLISNKISRKSKAKEAISRIGSSVFSGITITKFIGISVLAFAKTKIFTVFYFKMYLGIVLVGASHGLIFLPALLRLLGP